MSRVLALACKHFGSGFGALVTSFLRSHAGPGDRFLEHRTESNDPASSCPNLHELLDRTPAPSAVIGISVRPTPEAIARFRARGIPVVLIDEQVEGATTVACDNAAGGSLAARHLLEGGRRSLAIVCGSRSQEGMYSASLRVKGFEQALSAAGLPLPADRVLEASEYTRKEGEAKLEELLDAARDVDGIFCAAGDLCAAGMLTAARRRQARIPEQLAVIGFDDHPMSGLTDPPLTTIRQPLDRIAAEAYRLATAEAEAIHARPRTVFFPPELVPRRSTFRR